MVLKSKIISVMTVCIVGALVSGCTMFRYSIIPQEKIGPHGGALTLIDQRVSEFVEFVAIPNETEWTFQVFVYDKNLRQRDIGGSAYLTIVLPDGTRKGIDLWNTKPYFWSKGIGYYENKMKLDNPKEFLVQVSKRRGKGRDRLTFKYPYNQKGGKENEEN